MEINIRAYRQDDQEAIMRIWYEASKVGHPFISEEALRKDRQEIIDVYIPIAKQWVAKADGSIGGFIAMIDNQIGGLFVDPHSHKRGIGTALIEHVRPMFPTLTVCVFKKNPNAIRFYEKSGFRLVEERISEYHGFLELFMETKERE